MTIKGKRIDPYIAAPEGELGLLCHEIGHILALPDFYDTDGDDSGGRTPGLWQTSVMDDGCVLPAPPDFGAPEFDVLGLGECEPLAPGHYELAPLPEGRRYLKAPTDRKDEYFLFAVGPDGLLVYHIDRSDAPAGFCTRHGKDLTAAERWEFGAINDNPAHPCARLLPANPTAVDADATQTDALAFPQPGFESFGSDTPSAFRAWSGRASGLALTGIRRGEDGSVSFDVIEPIVLTGLTVYQDAALVSWTTDPALEGVQGFTVSWTDGTEEGAGSIDLDAGAVSCTLEGLKPQTAYSFSVQVRLSERDRFSVGGGFLTKVYRGGTYPYIYLNGAARNIDGSFPPGSKIPLRVFNATDVQEVRWTLDGTRISPAADGYYTIHRSGTLRATILHSDGSTETILKEITVQ